MAFGTYVEEALTRLDQAFLREFEEAVGVYRAVFLIAPPDANTDPSELSLLAEGGGGEGEGGGSTSPSDSHTHTLLSPGGLDRANPAYSELLEMVHALFSQQYMGALHKLFKANLAVIAATNTNTPTHTHYPLNALKHVLTGGIRRLHSLVKEASPMEKGVQLVQDVAKGLIFLEFRSLQTLTLQRLVALQEVGVCVCLCVRVCVCIYICLPVFIILLSIYFSYHSSSCTHTLTHTHTAAAASLLLLLLHLLLPAHPPGHLPRLHPPRPHTHTHIPPTPHPPRRRRLPSRPH